MGTAVSWMDSSPSSLPQPIHARNLILSLTRPRDSARKPFTIPSPEKLTRDHGGKGELRSSFFGNGSEFFLLLD